MMIMPGMLKTLNGWLPSSGSITHLFAMPMVGSRMNTHAIVWRIPGMISGTSDAANISAFPGTSVRTIRYASAVPSTIATAVEPNANASEFSVILPRPIVV